MWKITFFGDAGQQCSVPCPGKPYFGLPIDRAGTMGAVFVTITFQFNPLSTPLPHPIPLSPIPHSVIHPALKHPAPTLPDFAFDYFAPPTPQSRPVNSARKTDPDNLRSLKKSWQNLASLKMHQHSLAPSKKLPMM
jgi:hypothetical protein